MFRPRCQPQHATEKRRLKALDFRSIWENDAIPYEEFVESVEKNESLWKGVYRLAHIPDWAYEMACRIGPGVKLLGIAEDWCGHASNTIPVLARLGHEAECLDMKVIRRDEHPDVMDRYLHEWITFHPHRDRLGPAVQRIGSLGPAAQRNPAVGNGQQGQGAGPGALPHGPPVVCEEQGSSDLEGGVGDVGWTVGLRTSTSSENPSPRRRARIPP